MKRKIPVKDLDYVELYAKKLSEDKSLFEQQKTLIESQINGSSSLFKKMFGKKHFKMNARRYLRNVGLLN